MRIFGIELKKAPPSKNNKIVKVVTYLTEDQFRQVWEAIESLREDLTKATRTAMSAERRVYRTAEKIERRPGNPGLMNDDNGDGQIPMIPATQQRPWRTGDPLPGGK